MLRCKTFDKFRLRSRKGAKWQAVLKLLAVKEAFVRKGNNRIGRWVVKGNTRTLEFVAFIRKLPMIEICN